MSAPKAKKIKISKNFSFSLMTNIPHPMLTPPQDTHDISQTTVPNDLRQREIDKEHAKEIAEASTADALDAVGVRRVQP